MVLLPIALTRIIRHGTANHYADACQVSAVAKQNVKLTGNITVLIKCCEIPLPWGKRAPVCPTSIRAQEHSVAPFTFFFKLIYFRNEVHGSPILRF